jgi:hypothetical protein
MAPRPGKPRDPARERSWRRTIAEQARSGLSIAEFCRRRGLKPWTFRWWRRELARRDHQAASDRGDRAPVPPPTWSSAPPSCRCGVYGRSSHLLDFCCSQFK